MPPRVVARIRAGCQYTYAEPFGDGYRVLDGGIREGWSATGTLVAASDATLVAPCSPSKVVGVGANYPGDGPPRETPSIFLMPPSAVTHSGAQIRLGPWFGAGLAEGEVAVVIGRTASAVRRREALEYVAGFTIANDVSGRDSTLGDVPPLLKKGCDTFLPLGPVIVCDPLLHGLTISVSVNGETASSGNTADMVFGVAEVIEFVTRAITLEPGDVICMGAPPPKPRIVPGDTVRVTIDGIGVLENEVIA